MPLSLAPSQAATNSVVQITDGATWPKDTDPVLLQTSEFLTITASGGGSPSVGPAQVPRYTLTTPAVITTERALLFREGFSTDTFNATKVRFPGRLTFQGTLAGAAAASSLAIWLTVTTNVTFSYDELTPSGVYLRTWNLIPATSGNVPLYPSNPNAGVPLQQGSGWSGSGMTQVKWALGVAAGPPAPGVTYFPPNTVWKPLPSGSINFLFALSTFTAGISPIGLYEVSYGLPISVQVV